MTYLVMECHPAYAIVLDQAGRMIKVANMGYEAGQKVDFVVEQQKQALPVRMRFASAAIAACLCITLVGGVSHGAFFASYGTVQIKINPDVIMSVSYMDRVVGLEGLNEDGVKLIEQISYKGKNAEETTRLLVERAVDMGYLSDGGTVTVRVEAASSQWTERREADIGAGLKRQLEGKMAVEIKVGENRESQDGTGKEMDSHAASAVSRQTAGQEPERSDQPVTEEVSTGEEDSKSNDIRPGAATDHGKNRNPNDFVDDSDDTGRNDDNDDSDQFDDNNHSGRNDDEEDDLGQEGDGNGEDDEDALDRYGDEDMEDDSGQEDDRKDEDVVDNPVRNGDVDKDEDDSGKAGDGDDGDDSGRNGGEDDGAGSGYNGDGDDADNSGQDDDGDDGAGSGRNGERDDDDDSGQSDDGNDLDDD